MPTTERPTVDDVIEIPVSVDDVDRAADFYARVFGFEVIFDQGDELRAISVHGRRVLLLFRRKSVRHEKPGAEGGTIPAHDVDGETHLAFGVESEARLDQWIAHLGRTGIPIESQARGDNGGRQLYFRDTEGNLIELITRGVWKVY